MATIADPLYSEMDIVCMFQLSIRCDVRCVLERSPGCF
jgi:hypothetical protein